MHSWIPLNFFPFDIKRREKKIKFWKISKGPPLEKKIEIFNFFHKGGLLEISQKISKFDFCLVFFIKKEQIWGDSIMFHAFFETRTVLYICGRCLFRVFTSLWTSRVAAYYCHLVSYFDEFLISETLTTITRRKKRQTCHLIKRHGDEKRTLLLIFIQKKSGQKRSNERANE